MGFLRCQGLVGEFLEASRSVPLLLGRDIDTAGNLALAVRFKAGDPRAGLCGDHSGPHPCDAFVPTPPVEAAGCQQQRHGGDPDETTAPGHARKPSA